MPVANPSVTIMYIELPRSFCRTVLISSSRIISISVEARVEGRPARRRFAGLRPKWRHGQERDAIVDARGRRSEGKGRLRATASRRVPEIDGPEFLDRPGADVRLDLLADKPAITLDRFWRNMDRRPIAIPTIQKTTNGFRARVDIGTVKRLGG